MFSRQLWSVIAAAAVTAGLAPAVLAQPASCPLVYLSVQSSQPSSYDDTPEWAPPQDPKAVIDGNFDTRWASLGGVDNESIILDFGKPKSINKVVIHWERAFAVDYDLLVSADGAQWTGVASLKDQDGDTDEVWIPETTARYVKMVGTKRFHPDWGFSIWEFEAFGCEGANPGDRPIEQVFPDRKQSAAVELVMEDPLPGAGALTPGEFQRGMIFLSFHENQLASPEADAQLKELPPLNVGHVALVTTWYQPTLESPEMAPENPQGGRTPVDEALVHSINRMHALGQKVMLKPHIDVQSGEFRGDIPGSEEWFANYEKFILHYAKMAAQYHVELFAVGTELSGTSYGKWDARWREIIAAVRKVYPGPVIYAANWDEYKTVPFWDAVDFVGIDAYFPLTSSNDPTQAELDEAWKKYGDEIEAWRTEKGVTLPVVFTEIGYGSADGVNQTPWTVPSKVEDQAEQAACLTAMLNGVGSRDWFQGMYWWNWYSDPIDSPFGYPIRGKSSAEVLKAYYARKAGSAPAVPAAASAATITNERVETSAPPAPPVGADPAKAQEDAAAAAAVAAPAAKPAAAGGPAKVLFGFEKGTEGWGIPDWALEKTDMVGREVAAVKEGATEGASALGVTVDFTGGRWAGAIAEAEEYFDWSKYQSLSVDVTLPADAPAGLKAKIIVTVGENWEWTEMRRSIQLTAGHTTTLTASLAPGSEDWKRTVVDDAFRKDVRKLAIRVESNKPAYQGQFYIDNVRLE